MKIAIIGAGFTGLSAALYLSEKGHSVDIYESADSVGGLASGFGLKNWQWSVEKHYHHIFTSDKSLVRLASQVGHKIVFRTPGTSTWVNQGIYRLDTPYHLLRFSALPLVDRLRTGIVLAFLKINPFWQPLEHITAQTFIKTFMGNKSWQVIWQPLMTGKFSKMASEISAAWFWARIYKRSQSLGYPEKGFQSLADSVAGKIRTFGSRLFLETSVKRINADLTLVLDRRTTQPYDRIICTLPAQVLSSLAPYLPKDYSKKLTHLTGLGAINLVLSLNKPFLPENIYWLNVNIPGTPFLAVVEHTNFMDSSDYGNRHLVYIGNYLSPGHKFFQVSDKTLINTFFPYLKKINPGFSKSWIENSWLWKAEFAQPIVNKNYSRRLLPFSTPVRHLYLANMQQVYPWDRGTNYAVELGIRVAKLCLKD